MLTPRRQGCHTRFPLARLFARDARTLGWPGAVLGVVRSANPHHDPPLPSPLLRAKQRRKQTTRWRCRCCVAPAPCVTAIRTTKAFRRLLFYASFQPTRHRPYPLPHALSRGANSGGRNACAVFVPVQPRRGVAGEAAGARVPAISKFDAPCSASLGAAPCAPGGAGTRGPATSWPPKHVDDARWIPRCCTTCRRRGPRAGLFEMSASVSVPGLPL